MYCFAMANGGKMQIEFKYVIPGKAISRKTQPCCLCT